MIIQAWRLVREVHESDAFSGEGAKLYGGRWNPQGVRATYLSATRALAALEVLVHQSIPTARFLFFEVRFPARFVAELPQHALTPDWRAYPPRKSTVHLGGAWLKARTSPVLRIPSVVIPEEVNYLLNPEHPHANEVEMSGPQLFTFDPRFFKSNISL